jgi:hypothetical protein
MLDSVIAVMACGHDLMFPDASFAAEFMRMLAGQIPPEQYVDFVATNTPDPGAVRDATRLVIDCLGPKI